MEELEAAIFCSPTVEIFPHPPPNLKRYYFLYSRAHPFRALHTPPPPLPQSPRSCPRHTNPHPTSHSTPPQGPSPAPPASRAPPNPPPTLLPPFWHFLFLFYCVEMGPFPPIFPIHPHLHLGCNLPTGFRWVLDLLQTPELHFVGSPRRPPKLPFTPPPSPTPVTHPLCGSRISQRNVLPSNKSISVTFLLFSRYEVRSLWFPPSGRTF